MEHIWNSLVGSVADPHHFDADPEPEPAFHYGADPDPTFHSDTDPDPDPTYNLTRIWIRILPLTFFQIWTQDHLSLRLHLASPFHFDADPDPDPASQNDRNTDRKTEKNILKRDR